MRTKRAVALQYFLPKQRRNDRMNIQQLVLKKKPIFDRKKFVDEDRDEKIHATLRNQTKDSSVYESNNSMEASIKNSR